MHVLIQHRTFQEMRKIFEVPQGTAVPRVGDRYGAFYDPPPTVTDVVWSHDFQSITIVVD